MKDSGVQWIGLIPDDWNIYRLKFLLKEPLQYGANSSGVTFREDLPRYVRITDIKSYNELYDEDKLSLTEEEALQFILQQGDILFARSGATVGKSFIYDDSFGRAGFAGYLIRAKLNELILPKYLIYFTQSSAYEKWKNIVFIQSTIQNIGADKYSNLSIPLPNLSQQNKIVNFLDKKCSEIQSAIDNTKQTIEEYKKLKQAVITKAVTKGIRENRKLKDSGIEWIGQIPEEWECRRIKTLFNLRSEKNYLPLEQVNLISLYTDLGVVQHADIEQTTGNKAMNADGYKKVYKDDIVVNIILCWMGAIGRSAYNGVTSPAYDVYQPQENVNSSFYHYYFRTKGFNGDCFKCGKGIMLMRWRTYSDYFRDIRVVAPSAEEQIEIVNYLDKKCSQIDTLISQKEQFITELEKYKQSLIYEYVTGKKRVKGESDA